MVRLTALFTSVRVPAATALGATPPGLIEHVASPGDGGYLRRSTGTDSCLPPAAGAAIRHRPGSAALLPFCWPTFRSRLTEK